MRTLLMPRWTRQMMYGFLLASSLLGFPGPTWLMKRIKKDPHNIASSFKELLYYRTVHSGSPAESKDGSLPSRPYPPQKLRAHATGI